MEKDSKYFLPLMKFIENEEYYCTITSVPIETNTKYGLAHKITVEYEHETFALFMKISLYNRFLQEKQVHNLTNEEMIGKTIKVRKYKVENANRSYYDFDLEIVDEQK